jgi:galactokinase
MTQARGASPGRVNLIGEHTDYNGGLVLPAALSIGLEVLLELRGDKRLTIDAEPFGPKFERGLEDEAQDHWSDPVVGAMQQARALGLIDTGADITVRSAIPAGAGLSSSAALIVSILKAARAAANASLSDTQIAIAARRVETDYIGVPVGIMDQMAVAIARPGEAIALDTATLEYEVVSWAKGWSFEVIHSGISRKLSDGRYKQRKEECDAASAAFGGVHLCQLDPERIAAAQEIAPLLRRRARHCASEQRRVRAAIKAMAGGDMGGMGELMNAGHASLRDDFEVSLPAIDALVDDAVRLGAAGARLTGGGFGGCIVACVESAVREDWLNALLAQHPSARFIDRITPAD